MAIYMLDINVYSCVVLGEFSNVKDADVNAPEYEGAVMQCSNIAYKPGQSPIFNYRYIYIRYIFNVFYEKLFTRAWTFGSCIKQQCDGGLSISLLASRPCLFEIRFVWLLS